MVAISSNLPNNAVNTFTPSSPFATRSTGQPTITSSPNAPTFTPVEPTSEIATSRGSTQAATPEPQALSQQNSSSDIELRQARANAAEEQQEEQQLLEEQRVISELSARDREVRAHEQAHAAVGGQYAGAPSYQFQRGPDGVNYAVGGEVPIDISREATPEATLQKAQVVRRAALAPAEPSPQDRNVAAEATRLEAQARAEIALERAEEQTANRETRSDTDDSANAGNNSVNGINGEASGETNTENSASNISQRDRASAGSDSALTQNTNDNSGVSFISSQVNNAVSNTAINPVSPGSLLNLFA